MKKNTVYYDLLNDTALRVTYVNWDEVQAKEIKPNNGRAKMNESFIKIPIADIETKIKAGQLLKINNPKNIYRELQVFNYLYEISTM